MKSLIISLVTIFSFSTFASDPGVGTFATYKIQAQGLSGTMTVEVMGFDTATNKFTQKTTTSFGGQQSERIDEVDKGQILTRQQNEMLVQRCTDFGGTLRTITVIAGTMDTCYIVDNGQSLYYAAVAFTFAKLETSSVTLELMDSQYR